MNIRKTKLMRLSLQQAYSSSRMDESKMHSYFTLQLFKTLSQVILSTALVQLFEELALCYFLYWMSATHITKAATTLRRLVSPFCSHSKECSSSQSGVSSRTYSSETNPMLQCRGLQNCFKKWQQVRKHKLTANIFAMAVGFWPCRRTQLWLLNHSRVIWLRVRATSTKRRL